MLSSTAMVDDWLPTVSGEIFAGLLGLVSESIARPPPDASDLNRPTTLFHHLYLLCSSTRRNIIHVTILRVANHVHRKLDVKWPLTRPPPAVQ